jgi:hypothetical protein
MGSKGRWKENKAMTGNSWGGAGGIVPVSFLECIFIGGGLVSYFPVHVKQPWFYDVRFKNYRNFRIYKSLCICISFIILIQSIILNGLWEYMLKYYGWWNELVIATGDLYLKGTWDSYVVNILFFSKTD